MSVKIQNLFQNASKFIPIPNFEIHFKEINQANFFIFQTWCFTRCATIQGYGFFVLFLNFNLVEGTEKTVRYSTSGKTKIASFYCTNMSGKEPVSNFWQKICMQSFQWRVIFSGTAECSSYLVLNFYQVFPQYRVPPYGLCELGRESIITLVQSYKWDLERTPGNIEKKNNK